MEYSDTFVPTFIPPERTRIPNMAPSYYSANYSRMDKEQINLKCNISKIEIKATGY